MMLTWCFARFLIHSMFCWKLMLVSHSPCHAEHFYVCVFNFWKVLWKFELVMMSVGCCSLNPRILFRKNSHGCLFCWLVDDVPWPRPFVNVVVHVDDWLMNVVNEHMHCCIELYSVQKPSCLCSFCCSQCCMRIVSWPCWLLMLVTFVFMINACMKNMNACCSC